MLFILSSYLYRLKTQSSGDSYSTCHFMNIASCYFPLKKMYYLSSDWLGVIIIILIMLSVHVVFILDSIFSFCLK